MDDESPFDYDLDPFGDLDETAETMEEDDPAGDAEDFAWEPEPRIGLELFEDEI